MLEMKTNCERCECSLDDGAAAFICSYECTFCEACNRHLGGTCPNCSGELLARPRRGKQVFSGIRDEEWTAVLSGRCHCGAVQIELARVPESVTECNCSICGRYGARWAYYERKTARIVDPAGLLRSYSWGDKEIEFCHCSRCGCLTHYENLEKEPESRIAVNARMLDAAKVAQIPVRHFDGAVSWEYVER